MKARIIRIQSLLFFLILCAISCTEKEELVIQNTVPVFGRVEAIQDGYKFAFSATISIDNPNNPYYVYGFEVSSSADMADATVVAGKGLGNDGAFTGTYDLVGWKGGDIVYYRAFISRREGEEPLYSETFKVDVPKREYESLKFTSEGKSTIKLVNEGGNQPQLYYSYDEFKWIQWDYSELEFTKDKPVYINGDNPKGFSKSSSQFSYFSLSGSPVGCSGSIMTLIDRKNSVYKIPSDYCFKSLFAGCEILESAPLLPATTLADGCYYEMFSFCTKLKKVTCLATDISAEDCTKEWLYGVSSTGTFVKAPGMNDWTRGVSGIPEGWNVENSDGSEVVVVNKYLTFTSEGTTTISLENYGGNAPKLYYSYDKTKWVEWDYSSLEFTSVKPLYLCGDNPDGFSHSSEVYSAFIASGWSGFSCEGDIMSLINPIEDVLSIPSEYCFIDLFSNCSNLIKAPELPATTLADHCYAWMFWGCSNLQTAPELPATTLASYCYHSMFYSCDKLKTAPSLPATTLADHCYFAMFSRCSNLQTAPDLPATTLAISCYNSMFDECSSLQTAPGLPATTLADLCYAWMFWGCSSLKTAPELPATDLARGCYQKMFYGCTSLNSVMCLATDISAEDCTKEWLSGVASTGTFVKAPGMNDWTRGVSGIPEGWNVENSDGSEVVVVNKYLTFSSEGTTTISLENYGGNTPKLYYSYDKSNWEEWDYSSLEFTSTKPLYLCGDNPDGFSHSTTVNSSFITSGSVFSCKGDIMSLLNPIEDVLTIPSNYCYFELFSSSSNLISAPDLPARYLTEGCYAHMFRGCTSLQTTPALPATTLSDGCYRSMFSHCSSLQTAPDLPATKLATFCYAELFSSCSSLQTAPELPATTLADNSYYSMFRDCSSLQVAPILPSVVLAEGCYSNMFRGCSSLQTVPELPATDLAKACYELMFSDCANIQAAPVLPAITLASCCYQGMFYGCTSLNRVTCMATDISATYCTASWLFNVPLTGTFVKASGMNDWTRGDNGIPEGWTVSEK